MSCLALSLVIQGAYKSAYGVNAIIVRDSKQI